MCAAVVRDLEVRTEEQFKSTVTLAEVTPARDFGDAHRQCVCVHPRRWRLLQL